MQDLPLVTNATYRGGFRIRLTFSDRLEATVDFRPWLEGPVFEPLKAAAYFQRFFLDGGTVAWPNGADIAPETLYESAVRAHRIRGPLKKRAVPKARTRKASAGKR